MSGKNLIAAVGGFLIWLGTSSTSTGAEPEKADVTALRQKMIAIVEASPGFSLPDDHSALDLALAQDNVAGMRRLLPINRATATDVQKYLNWERYAQLTGGGFGVSFLYAGDLWIMAYSYEQAAQKTSDPQQAQRARDMSLEYKKDALTDALYTIALVKVDGARCFWEPASQGQFDDVVLAWKPIWQFGAQLSPQDRSHAISNAMKLERITAPLRQSDRWLCMTGWRNRPDAIAGLGPNWEGAKPVPSKSGEIGRTYSVNIDQSTLKIFRDEKEWALREDVKRVALVKSLGMLIDSNVSGGALPH